MNRSMDVSTLSNSLPSVCFDNIGGRFSVREHSSRYFNFVSDNLNPLERNLSTESKNGSGNGNQSLYPDNESHLPLTFSLDLHSPLSFHKTPSYNTGIAHSVEPVRSFDLHRSVDSLNSDSYLVA